MIIPAVVIMAVTLVGVTNKVEVSKKVVLRDGLGLIFCEFLLMYVIVKNKIDWVDGLTLMSAYLIYVIYMFTSMKKVDKEHLISNKSKGKGETPILKSIVYFDFVNIFFRKKANTLNAWSLLLFSMGIIGSACVLLINACETLAEGMGIAPYFIAVILASAATSLPDTILSYRDAIKGDYDDAIANALGSNIFDICFALGLPIFGYTLFKGPIVMPQATLSDVVELQISLIILTIFSFYIFYFNKGLKTRHSVYLIGLYILFVGFIFMSAYY
jgi:cation:H+ antiporter